jgi:hypothetical protein
MATDVKRGMRRDGKVKKHGYHSENLHTARMGEGGRVKPSLKSNVKERKRTLMNVKGFKRISEKLKPELLTLLFIS